MIASFYQSIFSRLTLGKRLALIPLLMAVAICGVTIFSWHSLDALDEVAGDVYVLSRAKSFLQDADMRHDALKADVTMLAFRELNDVERIETVGKYHENTRRFRDDMIQLSGLMSSPELKTKMIVIQRAVEDYIDKADELVGLIGYNRSAIPPVLAEFDEEFEKVLVILDAETRFLDFTIDEKEKRAESLANESKR